MEKSPSSMTFQEGKDKFIQSWGTLGSSWGINRTMAQIHALLLISSDPMCCEDIRKELNISMGNANMNLRALIDWGLVHKELKSGERKEFFVAEKDMWTVVRQVIIQRKKRELEPVIKVLDDISQVKGVCDHSEEFCKIIKDIKLFSSKADSALDTLSKSEATWFVGTFMKMIR